MHGKLTRSILGILLTMVFAMVLVPRGWLHHCDQQHVDHDHPDGATINGDLDCEVCAVLVATFDDRLWVPFLPAVEARHSHFARCVLIAAFRAPEVPASRGPPTC